MKSVNATKQKLLEHIDCKFYNSEGFVDYQKLRKKLHIKVKDLAAVVGRTQRAIEKNPYSEAVQTVLRKIVFILTLLREMLATEAEILIWFKSPNPDFGGLTPLEAIAEGEIEAVIHYLMDVRKGALS